MSLWGNTDAGLSLPKFLDLGQVKGGNVTTAGSNYSQGVTISFAAAPAGGTTATGTVAIVDGIIKSVNVVNHGAGYLTAPAVTITKPSAVAAVAATGSSGAFTVTVASATGIFVGMVAAGTGVAAGAKVTAINSLVVTLNLANTGAVSGNLSFTDTGASGVITSAIAPVAIPLDQVFFVDETEAQVASNKNRGITSPGWWKFRNYKDSSGTTRYKAELLVAFDTTFAVSGDATDDAFVPDSTLTVVIGTQPTNQTTVSGAATFTVSASITPSGTPTYQWEYQAAGTNIWTAVGSATSSSLVLAGRVLANSGDKYRVAVAGDGAAVLLSNAVTLTFGT